MLSRCIYFMVLILLSGCSTTKSGTGDKNTGTFLYFGSGFKGDSIQLFLDGQMFEFQATSDTTLGIDVDIYFKCINGVFKLIQNGVALESRAIATCELFPLVINMNSFSMSKLISATDGHYILIDYDHSHDTLRVSQSDKSFILE